MREAGIDSARLLYRVRSEREQAHAEELYPRPGHLAPGSPLRVGYIPGFELVWAEGRMATVFDPETHELLPAGALGDAEREVHRAVRAQLPSAVPVGVARLDATATVSFSRPADGWAMARGVVALQPPRRVVSERFGRRGHPETIYLHFPGGARVLERLYDKGTEARSAPEGMLWRFEAQGRYPKRERTTAGWWTMERVRESFENRFGAMATAAEGLRVRDELGVRDQLRAFVDAGTLTGRQAELLLGHIAAESVGIPRPTRTVRRRRAELRRLGLALALDGHETCGGQDVDVDLGELLREVVTSDRWSS